MSRDEIPPRVATMMRLSEIGRRVRALWRRSRVARELDEEMRLHLALRREQLQKASMPVDAAAALARRRFGNPLHLREDAMDAWGWRWLDQVGQDARVALRTLTRHRGFTLAAVCTLALGVGATTAVFSVVSGVVLRPLPFADPDRLVTISGISPLDPDGGPVRNTDTFRRQSRSFEAIAGYEVAARYLRSHEIPERVMAVRAEPDFFSILGVPPVRGRTFGPSDPPTVAVVAERFWRTRLAGDPSAIGRTLALDDQTFTMIGVMPASFQFPFRAASLLTSVAAEERTDLWIPLDPPLGPRSQIGDVIGRLRPSVHLAAAQSELAAIATQLEAQYPETNQGRSVRIVSLASAVATPAVRRPLFLLFGAVGLLLMLACSNIANVMLARLTLRNREIAVRRALGAGRLRMMGQFLTENLLLSLAAGVAALGLAWLGTSAMMQIAGARIPRSHEVGLDWRVFLFLFGISTLVGLGLSLIPVLTVGRSAPRAALQESGSRSTVGGSSRRVRDGLVVTEVALAFILAVGAALLVREFIRLRNTHPGMVTTNVITFHVGHRASSETDVRQFYEIADRVERLSDLRAAGFTQLLPLQNWGWTSSSSDFQIRGRAPARTVFPIELRFVTPGYFRALGIPIRGRAFTDHDTGDTPPVVIINETLAERSFPGEEPLGKTTTRGTIVGIVGDVRQANLDKPSQPELYTPIAQNWSQLSELGLTLVVSTRNRSPAIVEPVRAIVRDINPNLAVFGIKTMDRVVDDSLSDFTIYLYVIAAAAALALVLASTGAYAMISHMTAARSHELAIRVALGASRARVVRLVVGQGAWLTIIGLGCGAFGAFTGGRLLQGLPVSIRPPDAVTMMPVAAAIAAIALAACFMPAWRAATADPIDILRRE
ncbi:MAG: FtsX-like permease family protein [Luteitalea sp.]|nr:FtsX-like permease family protein [Luteitalea sp.]